MNLNVLNQLKSRKTLLINIVFYFFVALLAALIFCYFIFTSKTSDISQKINDLDQKMLAYASPEQKAAEKEVFDYKKKLEDFAVIIDSHKISSDLFTFLEKNTLPKVWYNNFNVSEDKGEINLSGEVENLAVLSSQVKIYEESPNYIKNVNVLNSQSGTGADGKKIKFTISLTLNPQIFADKPQVTPPAPPGTAPAPEQPPATEGSIN